MEAENTAAAALRGPGLVAHGRRIPEVQTATVDPLVGRLFEGRYRILDRIARGGMSTVYAAVDERLDRRVAVKVMSSALSSDEKFSDRFAREARAAARLTHVNAVAVYDQGVDDAGGSHHVFLVMELVAGRTLRDLIRERGGRFTPAEAVSIMEPVLSALSAAHRAGLVHRDIKPENILLSDDGLVKVADFGLARAIDADVASTRTGLMMGTVAYCAPEQIVHGRSDQRSDVYSAGIVLFELLTGRPPFQGESAMNVAYQHVHSRVPAPSSRVKGIPTPIDEIVIAATDSDPTGRPADASTLLAELADARAQLALPVVPIAPRARAQGPRPNGHVQHSARSSRTAASGRTTDVLHNGAYGRHDTEIVDRRSVPRGDAPPPPVVIPPPRVRVPPSPRARRRRRRLILLLAVLLLAGLSVGGGVTGVHLFREWNTHVPKVVGLSAAAAEAKLRETGYAVDDNVTNEFSETAPKNSVIGSNPVPGARASQGTKVQLVVSLGKDRVQVPDLHNESVAEAESTLQQHGLRFDPSPTPQHSITVKQGYVIRTDPPAGAMIKPTDEITLISSAGLPTVAVPQISANEPYDQVSAALAKAKFRVDRVDDYSDTVPSGDVISTDPAKQATYGSTITVTVSKGPQFVAVPEYTALQDTPDEYGAKLQAVGLQMKLAQVLGGRNGRILSVDPAPGTLLHPGDTVVVTVV
jgi:eukaryotic-like serine/threonine-protein kinase